MKKLLISLLILIITPGFSQDYKIVNGTSKKLFSTLTEPYSTYSLAIESAMQIENDSVYYNFFKLSSDLIESDTCMFWGGPFCYKQNIPGWAGQKIIFDNLESYQLLNLSHDTINLSLNTDGDGPIPVYADSIQYFSMMYVGDDTLTLFNELDSARIFTMSHFDNDGNTIESPLDGFNIMISKKFGLASFFVIDSFPEVLQPLKLIGNISPEAGFYQLTNEMVYDFQAGDEIQVYETSHYEGFQPPWLTFKRHRKLTYLERKETNDSLIYKIKQEVFYIDSAGIQTDTLTTKYLRSTVIAQIPFEKFDWRTRRLYQSDYCGQSRWTYSTDSYNDATYCAEDTCWGSRDVPGPPEHRVTSLVCGLGFYTDNSDVVGPDGYSIRSNIHYFKKDGLVCGEEVIIGVSEFNNPVREVKLHPNPANGLLRINSGNKIHQLMLIDLTGNVRLIKSITTEEISLDVSQLGEGLYFVSILFTDGVIVSRKLIVIK